MRKGEQCSPTRPVGDTAVSSTPCPNDQVAVVGNHPYSPAEALVATSAFQPPSTDTPVFVAHARRDASGLFIVHSVEEHATDVANLAARFAAVLDSAEWGRVAGLWHDLGKFHPEFQSYIRRATGYDADAHLEGGSGRVDHSTLGAIHACETLSVPGRVLAYVIAGHHAGLPDWNSEEEGGAGLLHRMNRNRERLAAALAEPIPPEITHPPFKVHGRPGWTSFWIRMLFSCLVDADFLDTEAFLDRDRARSRGGYPDLAELKARFDGFMAAKAGEVAMAGPLSPVNTARADVLHQCRRRAKEAPGLFSLTVPTGGGKTLASLAFALDHALLHGKRRVIYVIPYTSIIEQTADVFRAALHDEADEVPPLVEHHSNFDPERETTRSRLAAENWDAPVVVTTSVQFFESLFAARPSRCRKLHNVVDSVVVLDEAQLLPPDFLKPILKALQELTDRYGTTMVLCTATQPALEEQKTLDFHFPGLRGVREIVHAPAELHARFDRVRLETPEDLRTPTGWDELAREIAREDSVLCIVSRRDDARELFRLLPEETAIHLSALMCGEHRSRTLRQIRERLKAGTPVQVVSTQLVEAGVDLDFPVVYRALAGLDSIAQAAGRCNREGLLRGPGGDPVPGRVVVFVPPQGAPRGLLHDAEESGRRSLEERAPDPLAPDRFRDYFLDLYWKRGPRLDRRAILDDLADDAELRIRFRTAAEKFRLIDDVQAPVVVRYRNAELLQGLRFRPLGRDLLRRLQRFTVNIPRAAHARLLADGRIDEVHPGVFVLESELLYHRRLGLLLDDTTLYDPADLVG
jgi:CRISPR-associated endonuclease/helicase Cas3